MSKIINTTLADALGATLAQAADLKDSVADLKAELINMADSGIKTTAFEGDLFRATVTFGSKKVVDYKAVLANLVGIGMIEQAYLDKIIAMHTEVAEGVPTVKCAARKAA